MVIRKGFEPPTHRLEICCSIQLSYRTKKNPLRSEGGSRGGRIRTYDLLLPKQARYRATLHPEINILISVLLFFLLLFELSTFPTQVGTRYRATLHPEINILISVLLFFRLLFELSTFPT